MLSCGKGLMSMMALTEKYATAIGLGPGIQTMRSSLRDLYCDKNVAIGLTLKLETGRKVTMEPR